MDRYFPVQHFSQSDGIVWRPPVLRLCTDRTGNKENNKTYCCFPNVCGYLISRIHTLYIGFLRWQSTGE